uniref:WH2 domain-containing protein n=1 Tax=Pyxicephalus adspersus TaxID=30357 RepID=A0AAV3AKH8_PYXAD|nr:TPA: hypothetical protein GDO54_014416 [Pyxicephalus adspersus]
MSFTLEDTLESDWVAVRPNVFEEKERHKFVFIVAWNEVEGKFAITCHNRTAQRQRSADKSRSPRGSPKKEAGGSPVAAREEQPEEEECSWAGLFSFQDLRAVHQQLCSVSGELEPYLPAFPEEPSAVWSVLFGPPELSEDEVEELCRRLQLYLGHALDTCGWRILSQVLFTESDDPEEYYESLSELRHKGYEEVLSRARRRLHELLEKHKVTESMVDLLELYQMEDEAYNAVVEATTELYQYLLQPFRDMRELAMLRRQQIKMQSLHGGEEAIAVLDQLEAEYYTHQLQLYEVQFEILKCEELLLTAQLESIKRQMSEKRDEVVYYDTYESMEAMIATEDMAASIHLQREELHKLQQKVRQLEAKRGRISAKKAYLRNKKEICIAKHAEKIEQRLNSDEEYRAHHAAQLVMSSPMDEVLASLKRGSFHLKKVEQRMLAPFPDEDDSNNILAQIRKGVKLKKVQTDVLRESFTLLSDTDPLTRSIHEALRRIKEASPESEDEDESLPCTDWEN